VRKEQPVPFAMERCDGRHVHAARSHRIERRRVAAGQTYLDSAITDRVVSTMVGERRKTSASRTRVTEREEDVLRFVALGFLTKEIAARLGISIKTVETHKANAMKKMSMNSRIDIVRYARLRGWLQDT
jgi:DNA-binding NarL/FixJ family response regulator